MGCFEASFWPGNRSKAKDLAEKRITSEKGNAFSAGPQFKFSFRWLFTTYSGLIYTQTYLWLIKDMSWSQLRWFYPGMIFGTLALLWSGFLVVAALFYRAGSEAMVGIGVFLWVLSNWWWMIGELWGYQITVDSPSFFVPQVFIDFEYEGFDLFYEKHQDDTKIIGSLATVWIFFTVFILPFFCNDRDNALIASNADHCPRYRFRFFFRDFIEFENLHVFFWLLKDTIWAFDSGVGYLIGFAFTIVFMIDVIYYIATTRDAWVDLFHYISLFLWVCANGVWAYGELFVENLNEDDIPVFAYDEYLFIPTDPMFFKFFWGRNLAGYFFLLAIINLVVFYIYWIFFAAINRKQNVDEEVKEKTDEDEKSIEEKKLSEVKEVHASEIVNDEEGVVESEDAKIVEKLDEKEKESDE